MPRGGVQTSLVGMVQTMIAPFRGREGPGKGAQGPLNTGAAPGAKVTSLGCYITFELAEVALSRQMFAGILSLIAQGAGITRAGMSSARSSTASDEGRGMPRCGQSGRRQRSGAIHRRL